MTLLPSERLRDSHRFHERGAVVEIVRNILAHGLKKIVERGAVHEDLEDRIGETKVAFVNHASWVGEGCNELLISIIHQRVHLGQLGGDRMAVGFAVESLQFRA